MRKGERERGRGEKEREGRGESGDHKSDSSR